MLLRKSDNTGFEAATTHPVGDIPNSVAIGDLDGDGKPDLATANISANTVSVLLRKSDNTGFETATPHPVGNAPLSVAIGDLDGDGKPDLVTADYFADTVSALLRKSDNAGYEGRDLPPGRRRPAVGGGR